MDVEEVLVVNLILKKTSTRILFHIFMIQMMMKTLKMILIITVPVDLLQ
jgi:hypothetical protein